MAGDETVLNASCRCGRVQIALSGQPFLSVACYCDDCQAAGRRLGALPDATRLLDADDGTRAVMVRKDRLTIATGSEHLAAFHLTPESPTRRIVASCCNTPLFIDVTVAHWITFYADRLAVRPPVEMRVMTKYRTSTLPYPDDAGVYAGHTPRFVFRVLGAWIAMGFARPRLPNYPEINA